MYTPCLVHRCRVPRAQAGIIMMAVDARRGSIHPSQSFQMSPSYSAVPSARNRNVKRGMTGYLYVVVTVHPTPPALVYTLFHCAGAGGASAMATGCVAALAAAFFAARVAFRLSTAACMEPLAHRAVKMRLAGFRAKNHTQSWTHSSLNGSSSLTWSSASNPCRHPNRLLPDGPGHEPVTGAVTGAA